MARSDNGRWGEAEDEAFLAALAHYRHVRKAAAAIGWSVPTAQARRRRHPDFAARWAALTARPPLELKPLVAQPHRVGKGGVPTRPMRVRAAKPWTDAVEAEFLDMLAATCNVKLSAQTVGFHTNGIYGRRREDPAFERRWQAALAQGYGRLEMEFLRACAEAVEGVEFNERPIGNIDADAVLRLLAMHRNEVKGQGRRPGRRPEPPPIEQVIEDIRRRAAAIRAARKPVPGSSGPSPLAGEGLGRGGGGDSRQEARARQETPAERPERPDA